MGTYRTTGKLASVNLRDGFIIADMSGGFLRRRTIKIILSDDQDFLNNVAEKLGVNEKDLMHEIKTLDGKQVREHTITIIID